jgi:hypothetical protein
MVIFDDQKRALDSSKLIEICGCETGDGDTDDTYEIVVTMRESKSKVLNHHNDFQLLDLNTDLKKFATKDKKIIEYFSNQIINNVNSSQLVI